MTDTDAQTDLANYSHAMMNDVQHVLQDIEQRWGLYGYPPQIVGAVLSGVASGLDRDTAEQEALKD